MGFQNIAGAALGMGKDILGGYTQSAEYKTQAGAASTNAALDRISASNDLLQGEQEAQKYGRAFSQAFGSTKSSIVGSGTDATQGSALNRLNDLSAGGALDELTIRNEAANQAYGDTESANLEDTAAASANAKANASMGSGLLTAGLAGWNFARQNINGLSKATGGK